MKNALGTVQPKRCRDRGAEEQGGLHPLFLRRQSLAPALHKHRKGWYDRAGKRSELPRESHKALILSFMTRHVRLSEKSKANGPWAVISLCCFSLLLCWETEASVSVFEK